MDPDQPPIGVAAHQPTVCSRFDASSPAAEPAFWRARLRRPQHVVPKPRPINYLGVGLVVALSLVPLLSCGACGPGVAAGTDDNDEGVSDTTAENPPDCAGKASNPSYLCFESKRIRWSDHDVRVLSSGQNMVVTDFDQNGRDEILVHGKPEGETLAKLTLIEWADGEFRTTWRDDALLAGFGGARPVADRDLDGDGDMDILLLQSPGGAYLLRSEDGRLSSQEILAESPYSDEFIPAGHGVPYDGDNDGVLETIKAVLYLPEFPDGALDFTLSDSQWTTDGVATLLDGCESFGPPAYADFDGDTALDFVVVANGAACSPPGMQVYDPTVYRFFVFLVRPVERTAVYAGSYAAGGIEATPHVLDFNQDGRQDLLLESESSLLFAAGNGDGTFADGIAYDIPLVLGSFELHAVADFDGLPPQDMLIEQESALFVVPAQPDSAPGQQVDSSQIQGYNVYAVGDFNGDSLADIAFEDKASSAQPRDVIVLMSIP